MLRRDFTSHLIRGAVVLSCGPLADARGSVESLRELAAKRRLLVGSAVSYAELQRPEFTRLLEEQANIVVSENDMKWERIHPAPERFDFAHADALLAFATEHQQQVRGHNLCWHNQLPAWFHRLATPQNAGDLLRAHIATVAGHFAGHIHSWDVVNEAIAVEDGRSDGLRNSPWFRLLGPQYIEIAFRAAEKADPNALLTYNDYDLEQDTPEHERKRQAVLQLLASLRERGAPIHSLGIQSHLRAHAGPYEWSGLHRFLEKIERLQLQVFVTELDVDDSELPDEVSDRDRKVGELYRDYLTNVLQHRAVRAVLTWGLTDADTWLNKSKPRKDGLAQRPLPFDESLKPTPAFFAMRDTISAAVR